MSMGECGSGIQNDPWNRDANPRHIGSTNQREYLIEYLNKYGKILLRYGAFNPVKRFLIVSNTHLLHMHVSCDSADTVSDAGSQSQIREPGKT
jgi:hypothetical protein